jgi:hypothetical protein
MCRLGAMLFYSSIHFPSDAYPATFPFTHHIATPQPRSALTMSPYFYPPFVSLN